MVVRVRRLFIHINNHLDFVFPCPSSTHPVCVCVRVCVRVCESVCVQLKPTGFPFELASSPVIALNRNELIIIQRNNGIS